MLKRFLKEIRRREKVTRRDFSDRQTQGSYVQNTRRAKIPAERFIQLAAGDPDRGAAAPQTPAPRSLGAPD